MAAPPSGVTVITPQLKSLCPYWGPTRNKGAGRGGIGGHLRGGRPFGAEGKESESGKVRTFPMGLADARQAKRTPYVGRSS